MIESYKITAEAHPVERSVTIWLNGRFSEEALPELDQSINTAQRAEQQILLDLSEVTLVDRKAVQYLAERAVGDVKLVNCPIYLLRWITRGCNENGI